MTVRTVEEIQAYIVATLVEKFAAIGITIDPTQWSRRSLLRSMCFTFATGQATLEQLQDVYLQAMETIADRAPAASPKWVQDKMFKFQYSATDPQIIALINTIPEYPVVNEALRIITACSVTSTVANEESVKVAKGDPFEPLTTPEKDAAQAYITTIGVAGINYVVTSLDPDKMMIDADVYYQGQYSAVISARMIAAIKAWFVLLATVDYGGAAEMGDLEVIMKAVPGVNDVVLKNVRARPDADPYSAGTDLVLGSTWIFRKWQTIAGYLAEEDTAGHTLADSLNFIPE